MSKFSKISFSLLALVVVLYLLFIFTSKGLGDDAAVDKDRVDPNNMGLITDDMRQVKVTTSFENNIHTYKGVLTVPTPCHNISTDVQVRESFPEQVSIELTIIDTGEVCVQVLVDKKFEVSFQASEQARVQGFLDGMPIQFVENGEL